MRRNLRNLVGAWVAVAALLGLPATAARAHFIWATVEGGQARFALLEDIAGAPNPQFEKYVSGITPVCGGKAITPGSVRDGARYAALPAGANVVTGESAVGVKERGGETYLLIYHAKGAATLAAADAPTDAPAELLARRSGDTLTVTVQQSGWPVPKAEVYAQWPGQANPTTYPTDLKGEARIPWPAAFGKGFVGLRALVKEAKAGRADGKPYPVVHRWTTLTFPVEGTANAPSVAAAPRPVEAQVASTAPAAPGDKPFTQILRESYGVNHEVVGNALFNQAVFAGKLTRAQLEVHLQQRALVHNEVHRILIHAPASLNIPYGPEQKNVLTLLFSDLVAMGSGWPTEPEARPLTRDFLREIRESEKRGPYFALGVMHVYYGGITNGGRMIGAKIGETTGVNLAYYEKSDGYRPYAGQVNKISDPKAREEMIKGGQAAYRYIIASSNEDVFK